jgi:NAD(P)-dependent dehydrogenase (short-subunit alcohol dehydrogenase family)
MEKRSILLTGATSGIGKAAAGIFSQKGYELIIPVRNTQKAQKLIADIMGAGHYGNIKTYKCDFSNLRSVKEFADEIKKDCSKIDILINNAGIWNNERKETAEGIEQTWAVNVLAPYLLTREVMPLLEAGSEKRIIFTSSELHGGAIQFDDLEFKNNYSGFLVYQQSKLADLLISNALAEKLKPLGFSVNSFHPGVISTSLGESNGFLSNMFFKIFGRKPEKGAETMIFLASDKNVREITGEYFANSKVKRTKTNGRNKEMEVRLIKALDQKLSQMEL